MDGCELIPQRMRVSPQAMCAHHAHSSVPRHARRPLDGIDGIPEMTDPGHPESSSRRSLDDLTVDPGALEGDPFDRRARKGSTLRALSPRAWTAAALAV